MGTIKDSFSPTTGFFSINQGKNQKMAELTRDCVPARHISYTCFKIKYIMLHLSFLLLCAVLTCLLLKQYKIPQERKKIDKMQMTFWHFWEARFIKKFCLTFLHLSNIFFSAKGYIYFFNTSVSKTCLYFMKTIPFWWI